MPEHHAEAVAALETQRRSPPAAERAPSSSDPESGRTAFQRYLRGLSALPPLEHDRTLALAREVRGASRDFRGAVTRLRWVADAVLERWRWRRDRGLVTGLLRDGVATDADRSASRRLDARLEQLEHLLGQETAREPELLPEQIGAVLDSADIDLAVLREIFTARSPAAPAGSVAPASPALRRGRPAPGSRHRIEEQAADALLRRERARDEIVRHNLRLVVHACKRYRGLGCELEDLVQEGNMALLRAVDKFDPDRGFRFATYAMWWIEQAAIRSIQLHARTVRLPTHLHDRLQRLREVEQRYAARFPRSPSQDEIARQLDIRAQDAGDLIAARRQGVSLDEPLLGRDDEDLKLGDTLAVSAPLASELCDRSAVRAGVAAALDGLAERDRDVLRWRFGLDGPRLKLEEVGQRLGVCGERVRQIERAALRRLAHCDALRALSRDQGPP